MSIPFSRRWVALLVLPLAALSTVPLHLATATATVPTHHLTIAPRPGLSQLVAQRSRVQRVRFAPGEDSATIKTSVVSGTRDLYLLDAQKGQTMQVKITSLEDNAVFAIVAPPMAPTHDAFCNRKLSPVIRCFLRLATIKLSLVQREATPAIS